LKTAKNSWKNIPPRITLLDYEFEALRYVTWITQYLPSPLVTATFYAKLARGTRMYTVLLLVKLN
jgi:hypothetical protein